VRDASLRVKVTKSRYGPRHGRSTAGGGGVAMCGVYAGARLVGQRGAGKAALRPVGAGHVAPRNSSYER
jgi:hypothetical protein